MKFKPNYGSDLLNKAYEKFFKGEPLSYEEFVIMLSTNDELYFMYQGKEYQIEHSGNNIVHMCVSRYEKNNIILERNEKFSSIIELLGNFKIAGKSIHEIWPNVYFTKSK
jgi:hypothetical protein